MCRKSVVTDVVVFLNDGVAGFKIETQDFNGAVGEGFSRETDVYSRVVALRVYSGSAKSNGLLQFSTDAVELYFGNQCIGANEEVESVGTGGDVSPRKGVVERVCPGVVDGFAVFVKPFADVEEYVAFKVNDGAIAFWAYVQKVVASATYDFYEGFYFFVCFCFSVAALLP